MSSVIEIREATGKLAPEDYCELMAELHPMEDDEWDSQMKADADSGRLDFIDQNIDRARHKRTLIPMERLLEATKRELRQPGDGSVPIAAGCYAHARTQKLPALAH